MSFELVRPYIRGLIKELGYKEHHDAFDSQNFPSTKKDKLFQMESTEDVGTPANQIVHEFDYRMTLRFCKRGFRSPTEAVDATDKMKDEIWTKLLAIGSRIPTASPYAGVIKDIIPDGSRRLPASDSNDNDIILEIDIEIKLICNFS